jgi:hypothetical protein
MWENYDENIIERAFQKEYWGPSEEDFAGLQLLPGNVNFAYI